MKHLLRIEAIGHDARMLRADIRRGKVNPALAALSICTRRTPRAWVAELRLSGESFQRSFLRAKSDYLNANSTASRGVIYEYYLEEGGVYEVQEPLSWKSGSRYFLLHDGRGFLKLNREEACQLLRSA